MIQWFPQSPAGKEEVAKLGIRQARPGGQQEMVGILAPASTLLSLCGTAPYVLCDTAPCVHLASFYHALCCPGGSTPRGHITPGFSGGLDGGEEGGHGTCHCCFLAVAPCHIQD